MSAVKRRKQKLGAGDRAFNIVLGGLTAVSVVVILYPLIFVLVASISDPMEIFKGNVWLWPKGFNLEAYKQVFRNGDIFTGYKNTLIYTVVGTLVTIIITFSAAYPLSRKKLYGRSKLMGFFLFTMFFLERNDTHLPDGEKSGPIQYHVGRHPGGNGVGV